MGGKFVKINKTVQIADDYAWNNSDLVAKLERAIGKGSASKLLNAMQHTHYDDVDGLGKAILLRLYDSCIIGAEAEYLFVTYDGEAAEAKPKVVVRRNVAAFAVSQMSRSERKKYKKVLAAEKKA